MTLIGPQTTGEQAAGQRALAAGPTDTPGAASATEAPPAAPAVAAGALRCASCGAGLVEDQEWCVECGAARTVIRRAPDWRIPLAIVGVVVLLVVVAFAIALINLSGAAG